MIRNLKAMLLAALAVTALAALSASVAQAHPEFTAPAAGAATTTLKADPDGTGKTAHSVFDITNATHTEEVSFTCSSISGTGTLVGEANTDATFKTPAFANCTGAGQAVTVTNTGCDFTFTADGVLHIVDEPGFLCEHGEDPIDIVFPGCKVEVGKQTVTGIKYHNLTTAGATVGNNLGNNVTVEASNIGGITYKAEGIACDYGTLHNGTYTTGTAIVTGTRPVGTAVDVRWDSV